LGGGGGGGGRREKNNSLAVAKRAPGGGLVRMTESSCYREVSRRCFCTQFGGATAQENRSRTLQHV